MGFKYLTAFLEKERLKCAQLAGVDLGELSGPVVMPDAEGEEANLEGEPHIGDGRRLVAIPFCTARTVVLHVDSVQKHALLVLSFCTYCRCIDVNCFKFPTDSTTGKLFIDTLYPVASM